MRPLTIKAPCLVIGLDIKIEWFGVGCEPRPESITVFPGRGLTKSDALPAHIENVHFQLWLRRCPHAGKLPCVIDACNKGAGDLIVEGMWQHAHGLRIKYVQPVARRR